MRIKIHIDFQVFLGLKSQNFYVKALKCDASPNRHIHLSKTIMQFQGGSKLSQWKILSQKGTRARRDLGWGLAIGMCPELYAWFALMTWASIGSLSSIWWEPSKQLRDAVLWRWNALQIEYLWETCFAAKHRFLLVISWIKYLRKCNWKVENILVWSAFICAQNKHLFVINANW